MRIGVNGIEMHYESSVCKSRLICFTLGQATSYYNVLCIIVYMYVRTYVCYIAVPGDVGMVNVTCSPVDVINQCIVTWNVSFNVHI